MLVFVRSFSYTPLASFSGAKAEVGHKKSYSATVSLALLMLVLVRCFSYISHADFNEEFLLNSHAGFSEFLLHSCSF